MSPPQKICPTRRPPASCILAEAAIVGLIAAGVFAAGSPAWAADPTGETAELAVTWKRSYGEPPRTQIQTVATAAGGATYVPVLTYLPGAFVPGETPTTTPGADRRETIWRIDPATGERDQEILVHQAAEEGGGIYPGARDVTVLSGGDLLILAQFEDRRWLLIRQTTSGETVYRKRLWTDPDEESLIALSRVLPMPDGGGLLVGGRLNATDEKAVSAAYAVRVTAGGERLWDRSYDFGGEGPLTDGVAMPDGRVLLTGNAGGPSAPGEPRLAVAVIDAEGEPIRRTTLSGTYPAAGVTAAGEPVVTFLRTSGDATTCVARGLNLDSLAGLWETTVIGTRGVLDPPAITAVPGGFAVATADVLQKDLIVVQCTNGGGVRAIGRWRGQTLIGALSSAVAWQDGVLTAFWTVREGVHDGRRTNQVAGVGFKLIGEPE